MTKLTAPREILVAMLVGAVLVTLPPSAQAVLIDWTASLDHAQEVPVPPVFSSATGSAEGTFDTVTNELSWNIVFDGLTEPAFAAHFHEAPFGVAGPIVVPIDVVPPVDSPLIASAITNEAVEAALLAGNLYINIHTPQNPGGEIRGQVEPSQIVPEPASLFLLGVGLAGLGALGFRRRPRK